MMNLIRLINCFLSIFLLSSCYNSKSLEPSTNDSTTNNPEFCYVAVYQVYDLLNDFSEHDWANPRYCNTIEFEYGEILTQERFHKITITYDVYVCKGDGYYFKTDAYFDYKLTQKMEDGYTITSDIFLYYGCYD